MELDPKPRSRDDHGERAASLGIPAKSLADLQWERIVNAVARKRRLPPADDLPLEEQLPLATTELGMRIGLDETREATELLVSGEPIPLDGLRDVSLHLARVSKQGVLDGPALAEIASTVGCARALRRFIASRKERAPKLAQACATDPTLDELEDDLRRAVEPAGTLADHASDELRRLRTETANLRARIVARLEELVVKQGDLLQDRFYTQREGRYVLPVRADAHERVHGIVHGTSSSGATIFVEPRALVALGNRLKIAQAEMEREEQRILAVLSERVREDLAPLQAAFEALARADLRHACAALGHELRARFPDVVSEARVRVRAGRHPVLLLDGANVVPNDLEIAAGRALVVSGPNAGGKTVAMKLVGLCVLMARAGLPLPAAEGSECGFFERLYTDVGDEQSIAKSLSTFSAHIRNLARVVDEAGPRSLVLLDELAGGTDPDEGAALACAVVDALCLRGAAVIVTTHYEQLKAHALGNDHMQNAAVGFDVARLAPTFHLMMGVPGASSALAVARQFGLAPDVVMRAEALVPTRSRSFDELARKLEDAWRKLEEERAAAAEEHGRAAVLRREAEAEVARQKDRAQSAVAREADKLLNAIRESREELRVLRAKLRERPADAQAVQAAERQVDEVAKRVAVGSEVDQARSSTPKIGAALDPATVRVGQRVWVTRLRAEAEVVEPPSRGRVRVSAGALKVWVDVAELRAPGQAEGAVSESVASGGGGASDRNRSRNADVAAPSVPRVAVRTDDNSLDVRGMRVDDALTLLEAFVDRLYGAEEPVGFVLHGLGTGALKDAVRHALRNASRYVLRVRAGESDEGGDRITVFELR